jgi:peptide/nickel transport system permease protein
MVLRRLGVAATQLLLISFGVFSLLALSPGSPEQLLAGGQPMSPEALQAIREQYHLDDPFLTQYWHWLSSAVQFDFGSSIRTKQTVTSMLGPAFTITAQLAAFAVLLTVVVAIPLGLLAASRRGTRLDYAVSTAATVASSAPVFAIGLLLLVIFGVQLELLPVFGAGDGGLERLEHLLLPSMALATAMSAFLVRQTRAAALNVVREDYMTFARARGIRRSRIWTWYLLRNASLPVLTATGLLLAYALSGAIVVEVLFSLPGLGTLLISAANGKDVPVIQGIALALTACILVINLAVEALYGILDPRVAGQAR